jgi:F-type H+-transporting ATPase subunit b
MFLIPHVGTIFWTTIIFLILLFILKKFAWKPMLRALDSREKAIEKTFYEVKQAEMKIENLSKEQDDIIRKALEEKEKIIQETSQTRERMISESISDAKGEAEKIISDARKQIIREREASLFEMKNQIASLSIEIATKVVGADMEDKGRHEKMVRELVNEIDLN